MAIEDLKRKAWKNCCAIKKYDKPYLELCSDRRRIIDQMFLLHEMEGQQKKGCRDA